MQSLYPLTVFFFFFFFFSFFFFKDVLRTARGAYHKPLAESFDTAIKQVFTNKTEHQIKIIDVGAGTGVVGTELLKLGYTNLYALDISQEMLNEARKKNVYKKFICAALNDQRIPDIETGEFDALICGGTLGKGHVRPPALDEMTRMVKNGKFNFDCVAMFSASANSAPLY